MLFKIFLPPAMEDSRPQGKAFVRVQPPCGFRLRGYDVLSVNAKQLELVGPSSRA